MKSATVWRSSFCNNWGIYKTDNKNVFQILTQTTVRGTERYEAVFQKDGSFAETSSCFFGDAELYCGILEGI